MSDAYSSEVCLRLASEADDQGLHRPRRITRYEPGRRLTLPLTGVAPVWKCRATFELEAYVGGGFAGQVYRARLESFDSDTRGQVPLQVGQVYALKLFVPWSGFGRWFRNTIYGLGFQAPFGLQGNADAVRAAALWQKVIRRAAKVRFGSEEAVVDVHATFYEPGLGTMGEVLEWVDGRVWRLEVDEGLFLRKHEGTPSRETEYTAKRHFMREMVALFHEVGAPEFARQYEWWTMKSQPNVLKRRGTDEDPAAGLVAVDFGAGLALLPILPMSPGDVLLIGRGLGAGRVVQFDCGDLDRLSAYVARHAAEFTDLGGAIAELHRVERAYHGSQLDAARNHVRLLWDGRLWTQAAKGWVRSWRARGTMDLETADRFRRSPVATWLVVLLGLIPLLGPWLRKLIGSAAHRAHWGAMLTSAGYLCRAFRARQAEILIDWHRKKRVTAGRVDALMRHPVLFWLQVPLGVLPAGWHRFVTSPRFAWDVFRYIFLRPIKLFAVQAYREQWLLDMIDEGEAEGIMDAEEARAVRGRVKEPYIQTYLWSMVVHAATIPVTQIVSVLVGAWLADRYAGDAVDAGLIFGVTMVLFQVTPISPGSITRGLYATGLALWKRDWKNYSWAVVISYWKYIGYLGFPIQMVKSYPTLSRFLAARWATHATGIVPVFGERGALLEYAAFNALFNGPISLRRKWEEDRKHHPPLGRTAVLVGTLGGLGFLPGPTGTYGSIVTAGLMVLGAYLGLPLWGAGLVAVVAAALGIWAGWACGRVTDRKDPRWFIWDEVVGQVVASLAMWLPGVASPWAAGLAALAWFRVFDIVKPPPVRQAERLPGAWGIMADDLLAGGLALGATWLCWMAFAGQGG